MADILRLTVVDRQLILADITAFFVVDHDAALIVHDKIQILRIAVHALSGIALSRTGKSPYDLEVRVELCKSQFRYTLRLNSSVSASNTEIWVRLGAL